MERRILSKQVILLLKSMTAYIGREKELDFLIRQVEIAASGKGKTVLIAGEAGIGKTRLVEECEKVAQSKGFKILKGWCMYNSLTPYLPMREALRSGGMEHLVSIDLPPRLETVLLVTNTGLLMSKCDRGGGASTATSSLACSQQSLNSSRTRCVRWGGQ